MHVKILLLTAHNWFMGFQVMFVAAQLRLSQSIVAGKAEISSTWPGSLYDEWRKKLPLAKTRSCWNTEAETSKENIVGGVSEEHIANMLQLYFVLKLWQPSADIKIWVCLFICKVESMRGTICQNNKLCSSHCVLLCVNNKIKLLRLLHYFLPW